jgi:hypothetical protein
MRHAPVLLVIGLLAGCLPGTTAVEPSTTTTPDSTTSTTRPMTAAEATVEFAACMEAGGVELSSIPLDANGRPDLQAIAAEVDTGSSEARETLGACASILVAVAAIDLRSDPEARALVLDYLTRYADCMRAEGVDEFPDPSPDFAGAGSPFPVDSVPFDHPSYADADATCQRLIGVGG